MKIAYYMFLSLSSILCSCHSQSKIDGVNDNIVIVNAGASNRIMLAKAVTYLNSMEPKVIAIDFQFAKQKEFYEDSLLISSLNQCKNLILAIAIKDYSDESKGYTELVGTLPEFQGNAKLGFANLLLEKDEFQTLKRFSIYEEVNGRIIYPFGIRSAMSFDSLKTVEFLRDKPKLMDVDYKGDEKVFNTISYQDLVARKISAERVKGKIVLLGFMGLYEGYQGTFDEDKFFSPLNNRHKPYKPDMYGVVYHANIVAQVLAGN